MKLLLDTHTLIWWTGSRTHISMSVRDAIGAEGAEVFVSAATAWEIAIKMRLGKLSFSADFLADFDASLGALGFMPLPVSSRHAVEARRLPGLHKDPFDRLLAAQAMIEGLTIATIDKQLAGLGVRVIW